MWCIRWATSKDVIAFFFIESEIDLFITKQKFKVGNLEKVWLSKEAVFKVIANPNIDSSTLE